MKAFADSDWAGDRETRKSITGYVVMVIGSPVSWKSQRQTIVALSSAEAEYVALSTCSKNLVWMRRLFWELHNTSRYHEDARINKNFVFVDNTAAMSLASSGQVSAKSKHIEVKYHHVRDLIIRGVLVLAYIPTQDQVADLLTKAVDKFTLDRLLPRLLN